MKSASNGGILQSILQSRLQMLHIHLLLVAPLSADHMAYPDTDQHEGGVAVRETAHYTGSASDLPVEPLYNIV